MKEAELAYLVAYRVSSTSNLAEESSVTTSTISASLDALADEMVDGHLVASSQPEELTSRLSLLAEDVASQVED